MKQSALDKRLLEQATETYARNVGLVAEYLEGRGIPREVAATHRLGYVAEPTPGLGDDEYVGRLTIPYLTPSGVVDIRFRTLDGGPKYLSRPGSGTRMFNVNALFTASTYVGICEGELDALVATSIAHVPSVGVAGASNWQKHYPLLFEGFQRVYVFTDGDDAGRDFGKKVVSTLDQAVIVAMPDSMDVNDVVRVKGPTALKEMAGIRE